MKTPDELKEVYYGQNKSRKLTPRQSRRIRKAENRLLGYPEFNIENFSEAEPPGALLPEEQTALIRKLVTEGDTRVPGM